MQIILDQLSKKYPKNKLFDNLSYTFESDQTYAVTGENGSGKSTLIKIIAGVIAPTTGSISFYRNNCRIETENVFSLLGIAAPYLQLIEEYTLNEHLNFHSKFKAKEREIDIIEEIENANLAHSLNKPISEFSSGMQQRLKLILCCCFDAEVLLLDEPTSHLDTKGIAWYKDLLSRTSKGRLTLIASNNPEEYNDFAKKIVNIENLYTENIK